MMKGGPTTTGENRPADSDRGSRGADPQAPEEETPRPADMIAATAVPS